MRWVLLVGLLGFSGGVVAQQKGDKPEKKAEQTFDEAWKGAKSHADELRKKGAEERAAREKLFSDKEVERLDGLFAEAQRKKTLAQQDYKFLAAAKVPSLAASRVIESVLLDEDKLGAELTLKAVWERSPKGRGDRLLLATMYNWYRAGAGDRAAFAAFFAGKKPRRVKDLADDEKRALVRFAGEEAIINSP
jgi:serine phosphatase RsbU (regulator of sigma subunit)